ncbi:MAG: methylenetetrahydrofolate reductase [Desulfonatronovibrionaceae bacterium]
MRILDKIRDKHRSLSLEFFPPKEEEKYPRFWENVEQLSRSGPDFVSITCGAGGTGRGNTMPVARTMKQDHGLEVMVHQTCVNSSREELKGFLQEISEVGIDNVLALRGDQPRDPEARTGNGEFDYASELVEFLKAQNPDLCVAAAAYPGAHPESPSIKEDLYWLKHKVEKGVDLLHTQFFFDNRQYFDFVDRLQGLGIECPVIPGVLPILSFNSLRYILSVSGTMIPGSLFLEVEKIKENQGPEGVLKFGIDFAAEQINDLLEKGAPGVHLYTLNRAQPSLDIINNCPF